MTKIVSTQPARLPVDQFQAPTLPPPVTSAVYQYLNEEKHGTLARFGAPILPSHLRKLAGDYVAEADAASLPAGEAVIAAWLATVAAAMGFPPTRKEVENLAVALCIACQDVPGWAFNQKTAVAAIRAFERWPSAASVRSLVLDETADRRGTIRALRALSKAPEPVQEAGRTYPTGKTREAMATVLRGLVREVETKARTADETPLLRKVEPNHPAPAALAELRRAAGIVPKGDA